MLSSNSRRDSDDHWATWRGSIAPFLTEHGKNSSSETEQPGPSKRLKRSYEDRKPERVQEAHIADICKG